MQARVKNQNEICTVYLSGRVDVETAEPFRAACLRELKGKRIVFDFSALSFVGSQGILPFLETLQVFYEQAPGSFKFSGVGTEFRKVFAAIPLNIVEIHETVDIAVAAFFVPSVPLQAVTAMPNAAVEAAPLAASEYLAYRSEPVTDQKTGRAYESDDELDA